MSCLVQVSFAFGVAEPSSLFVGTYGTEYAGLLPEDITNVLKAVRS